MIKIRDNVVKFGGYAIRSDGLKLVLIALLAYYIAYIPHQGYPLPVHMDEWRGIAYAKALIAQGTTSFTDPFGWQAVIGFGLNVETGYHLLWGVFQRISGIPWEILFRYAPGFLFIFTISCAYILGRQRGFGWEAAFLTCLIPTTVGILGPAFMVPVAMALPFILMIIFLAFCYRHIWAYVTIFILTCFTVMLHIPSTICLIIIMIPYILINLKGNRKHSLGLAIALVAPFLLPFPWITDLILPTFKELLVPQTLPGYVTWPDLLAIYGYIPLALTLLGVCVLAYRSERENYGLVLGAIALMLMLLIFKTFHYGIAVLYERGLMVMMLMMGICGGAGLAVLKNIKLPGNIFKKIKERLTFLQPGYLVVLALIIVILFIAVPVRQSAPYYHVINEAEYEDFMWIRDNLGSEYEWAILDPWKATPFTAITGKKVYSRIHIMPYERDEQAYKFLADGCVDSDFIRENLISIVYTNQPCRNEELIEVRENVYLFTG
jgi:hypothetical protein